MVPTFGTVADLVSDHGSLRPAGSSAKRSRSAMYSSVVGDVLGLDYATPNRVQHAVRDARDSAGRRARTKRFNDGTTLQSIHSPLRSTAELETDDLRPHSAFASRDACAEGATRGACHGARHCECVRALRLRSRHVPARIARVWHNLRGVLRRMFRWCSRFLVVPWVFQ